MADTAAPPKPDAAELALATEAVRRKFPDARVITRRGRVFAVEGDLIRLVSFKTKPSDKTGGTM